ncbi:hypothetical protein ACIP4Y_36610 [Streptomyces sp. NPDC088810]|uniref:nSTAND1 domain-containing NTPase n=1 Tax=Streptomyces sp. NPDC088810 TaxID=3365904 RepID=UPI00380E4DD0
MDGAGDLLARLADARLLIVDDGVARLRHDSLLHGWPRLRTWDQRRPRHPAGPPQTRPGRRRRGRGGPPGQRPVRRPSPRRGPLRHVRPPQPVTAPRRAGLHRGR